MSKRCSPPPVSADAVTAAELAELRDGMLELERHAAPVLTRMDPVHRDSARNLVHYLALRRQDLRQLQERLAALGLSSLGRAESHALASLSAVLERLGAPPAPKSEGGLSFKQGRKLLETHTDALFGPPPGGRRVRMMVTMPSEAAENPRMIRELLENGMDCMRINCAHDHPEVWGRMIEHLRRARRESGRRCRVLMDLGGPKLRTGPVEPDVPVLKWRPQRDRFGRVTAPARIWLHPPGREQQPDGEADGSIAVEATWLAGLHPGDGLDFTDARDALRMLRITGTAGPCRWAETVQTAYVTPETVLHLHQHGRRGKGAARRCRVGGILAPEGYLLLRRGDVLRLTRSLQPGKNAAFDQEGRVIAPATIGCTLPQVFTRVRPGDRVWLDDGRIGGVVRSADRSTVTVEITAARPQGDKLRGEKGINLPDTDLGLPALSKKDREDLRFIARHAHLVGLSFAQRTEDILDLQSQLRNLGRPDLGIVLKIETRRGFEMLPDLLLAAMHGPAVGVMIARGDLAVECGYERLAEVQEEILWLCEAAHLPVVWATQVLDTLARTGAPSRAEITDAAMGERAECVMLNKGPHILEAMRVLEDILRRMEEHQDKKSSRLRRLRWWEWPDGQVPGANPGRASKARRLHGG
ncbi:MAG: pyruvate kinase [Candidatus Methylomirabilia bacterium]